MVYIEILINEIEIFRHLFCIHYAVNHQDYTKWFSPVILAVDTGAFMSDKLRQLARGVIYGEEREGVKLSTTDTTHWHVSARLYIAQHWVQCSHSCSLHSSLQHLYFQARLLSTWRTPHCLVRHQGPQQSLRRACSQVILLNHQIEAAKARYDRARAVKRLSFRYSNRLKLTVSRAFAILSTSSPVSSVKKSRPAANYGNSLVVFTTLKNQTSLILTTSLATAKYTTGICLLRALIRASTLSKKIIHAVAATS